MWSFEVSAKSYAGFLWPSLAEDKILEDKIMVLSSMILSGLATGRARDTERGKIFVVKITWP